MGLFKNTTDILVECAKTENYTAPSTGSIEESISNLLEEFNETDNVFYTEEMVNVQQDSAGKFIIEFDSIEKYLRGRDLDMKGAINAICEHVSKENDVDMNLSNTIIAIESVEDIMGSVQRAAICAESHDPFVRKHGQRRLKSIYEALQELKSTGVEINTKPSQNYVFREACALRIKR